MRTLTVAMCVVAAIAVGPALAQQPTPNQNLQNEADKGVKTHNSGASGYVGDQEKTGAAAHPPGKPGRATSSATGVGTAPSAQNSGAGISGAPGNKNGPAAQTGTVGSASQNLSVQEQDSSNVKGLPGNKSGPPAKR
jgi:hypothetical protein